jgi:hypothetical protein
MVKSEVATVMTEDLARTPKFAIEDSFSSAERYDSLNSEVFKESYTKAPAKTKYFGGDDHHSTRSRLKNSSFTNNEVSYRRHGYWHCEVILVLGLLLTFVIGGNADVTTTTWSTSMTQHHTKGSFNITTTDSGTSSAEMQLTSISYGSTSNSIYMAESPQSATGGGFTLSYEIKVDSASVADSIFAFIGTSSIPSQEDTTTAGTGMIIAFIVYQYATSGKGIYLRKTTSSSYSTVATYTSGVTASGNWESITITYTPSSTNTWKVCSCRCICLYAASLDCLFLSVSVCLCSLFLCLVRLIRFLCFIVPRFFPALSTFCITHDQYV